MGKINSVKKLTDNKFVNLYGVDATSVHDTPVSYFVASRAKSVEDMKLSTGENHPDGVIIYSVYGEKRDKVVLIRQYRYTIGGYIYEFPAGLVEPGEDFHEGAVRESCATVYGYASGEVSKAAQEDSEEIEVVIADRDEVRRILKEERVAIMCAYMLMHFLKDEEPFDFLKEI